MNRYTIETSDWPKLLLEDTDCLDRSFDRLLEKCKCPSAREETRTRELHLKLEKYDQRISQIQDELSKFREFLKELPIIVTIGRWIRGLISDSFLREKYLANIAILQEKQIIHYVDDKGKLLTLNFLIRQGHHDILEEIRCVKEWSLLEKEESVRCYLAFSHSLAHQTLGLIPGGFDPDRMRVRNKMVKYEAFLEFSQHLSDRDALIAKLLYFGAPSIEEVLNLRKKCVDMQALQIYFSNQTVSYPKHVIKEIEANLMEKSADDLFFVNARGDEVDRVHLNHSFSRASDKTASIQKITPGGLLKLALTQ